MFRLKVIGLSKRSSRTEVRRYRAMCGSVLYVFSIAAGCVSFHVIGLNMCQPWGSILVCLRISQITIDVQRCYSFIVCNHCNVTHIWTTRDICIYGAAVRVLDFSEILHLLYLFVYHILLQWSQYFDDDYLLLQRCAKQPYRFRLLEMSLSVTALCHASKLSESTEAWKENDYPVKNCVSLGIL